VLPPGFVLRSQKKAAEEAAKSKVISLEEFLEVEVRVRIMAGDLCYALDVCMYLTTTLYGSATNSART
jgi:hypothetical protein